MIEKEPYQAKDSQSLDIRDLEKKLDQLIELYSSVKNENELLKSKQDTLMREKAQLVEKTTLARNRVEAMISRLKTMGQGS
jgi:cell division protein ZapB